MVSRSQSEPAAIRNAISLLVAALLCIVLYSPRVAAQQGPETGSNELRVWTGAGHSTDFGVHEADVINIGVRYGRVITEPHGPGFLRGRFEYAVELVPAFWVFEPNQRSFGAGGNPVVLQWNMLPHGRIAPYTNITGGILFTNRQVPPGTSRVNFATSSVVGLHFLQRRYSWSGEIVFMHISNASLSDLNPGINTLQLRVGFGLFTRPK